MRRTTTYSEAHVRNWMNPVGERKTHLFFWELSIFWKPSIFSEPSILKKIHFWGTTNFFWKPSILWNPPFWGKTHLFFGKFPFLRTPSFLKNFHIFENPLCFGNFTYSWDQFSNLKELFNYKVFLRHSMKIWLFSSLSFR